MTKRFVFMSVVLCLCLLMAGVPAVTQVRTAAAPSRLEKRAVLPPPKPASEVSPLRWIARYFGLTPEQAGLLKGYLENQRQTVEPLAAQVTENEKVLRDSLAGNAEPATVGQLVIDIHALRERILEAHKQLIPNFESILNEEQLRKLQMLRQAARLQPVVDAMRQLTLLPRPPSP